MFYKLLKPISLLLLSTSVLAHTGGYTVSCSASGQPPIQFQVERMNQLGLKAPKFSLILNGKTIPLNSPDENQSYGQTIRDLPIGLLYITAINATEPSNAYELTLKGIPNTIKSANQTGQWSISQEQNACYDSHGKASFQAILSGQVMSNGKSLSIKPTLLQCTIIYNSGMSC